MIEFDFKNANINWFICNHCNTMKMMNKKNRRTVCDKKCTIHFNHMHELVKKKKIDEITDPVWIDNNGDIKHELPPELIDLTLGEKMLVQKHAVLIPVIHIYKGRVGIRGNTVMFKKNIASVCETLPRKKVEIVYVKQTYSEKTTNLVKTRFFKVRRSKILEALKWLKKYHRNYNDIEINEDNLNDIDWEEDGEIGYLRPTIVSDEKDIQDINKPENNVTVADKQTNMNTECEVTIHGVCGNGSMQASENAELDFKSIVQTLKNHRTSHGNKMDAMLFPHVEEEPIDEYKTKDILSSTYPWLFPGGIGDILHKENDPKKRKNKNEILRSWAEKLMTWKDGRFLRDPLFTFHLPDIIQRHKNNSAGMYFVKQFVGDKSIGLDEVKEEIEKEDYTFVKKLLHFSGEKVQGSDAWWRKRKYELDTWITHHVKNGNGPPTLFLTFSCAEYWWKDILKLIQERCKHNEDRNLADIMMNRPDTDEGKSAKFHLINKYEGVVQQYFQMRLDNWLETIGKNIFGITHYWLRFEFAKGRGQIHAHLLAITSDQHITKDIFQAYKNGTKQKAAETAGLYVRQRLGLTAEKPNKHHCDSHPSSACFHEVRDTKEDLSNCIEELHMHECNDFCLRLRKRYVKCTCKIFRFF